MSPAGPTIACGPAPSPIASGPSRPAPTCRAAAIPASSPRGRRSDRGQGPAGGGGPAYVRWPQDCGAGGGEVKARTESDLIDAVAAHGLSKRQSASVVGSLLNIILRCVEKGEGVKVVGFGHFRIRQKLSRR